MKTSKNMFFSRLIVLFVLTCIASYFFIEDSNQKYIKGTQITKQDYMKSYDKYRTNLLDYKKYTNVPLSTFVAFIGMSFIIGAYELTVLLVGFLIGKIITR